MDLLDDIRSKNSDEGSSSTFAERYWDADHPVLDILRRRRNMGSKPGERNDSAKVALAVAGGGMRGAISAAMCAHLDEGGFKDAFDVVYGCSSGAINAAYFIAQEPRTCWYPLSIYYEDLATKQFIGYTRALRGGSMVDLDYVFGNVLKTTKPLNYQAVMQSRLPLVVAVTDLDVRKTVTVRTFATAAELEHTLRAGARLPLAMNDMSNSSGRRLLDGALLTPLPFRLAVQDGCTHILSLSTHRMEKPSQRISLGHRAYSHYLDRIRAGLGSAYLSAVYQRQRDREWLLQRRFTSTTDEPYVLDLAPLPWMGDIRFHDNDPSVVFDRIRSAYAVSYCATEGVSTDCLRDGLVRATPRIAMIGGSGMSSFSPDRGIGPSINDEPAA